MVLINLTRHTVTVFGADGQVLRRLPAAVTPVWVPVERVAVGDIDGVPVVEEVLGACALPASSGDTRYIVPWVVAASHPERTDLLVPTDLVHGADGSVLGCRALCAVRHAPASGRLRPWDTR